LSSAESVLWASIMRLVYKIVDRDIWHQAVIAGRFAGAAIDLQDGYIHLSDGPQVVETAKLHFAGQHNLLLVAFDALVFGDVLKWEASRGGALFPHLYVELDPTLALWAKALPWTGTSHTFPLDWHS
jgi:uncharacterized protein (DUF952 family)